MPCILGGGFDHQGDDRLVGTKLPVYFDTIDTRELDESSERERQLRFVLRGIQPADDNPTLTPSGAPRTVFHCHRDTDNVSQSPVNYSGPVRAFFDVFIFSSVPDIFNLFSEYTRDSSQYS